MNNVTMEITIPTMAVLNVNINVSSSALYALDRNVMSAILKAGISMLMSIGATRCVEMLKFLDMKTVTMEI